MSKFYDLPGSHLPAGSEASPLLTRRQSLTYFRYRDTPVGEQKSSKYDLENPHRNKLGTFNGVFVPTALNVLSILMFLRFGFIIGQMGILGTFFLLGVSFLIDLLTTLSISAISTNGIVRGGGAYYMISRCLGPEFGGSIGLIFFVGQILNSGMNIVGIVEPLLYNFGATDGVLAQVIPEGHWYEFLYSTVLLLMCLGVALVGSQTVSRAGNVLFWLLLASTISIPVSVLFVKPFEFNGIIYTGPSFAVLKQNLYPKFTKGAAGSLMKGKETFNDLFGIFFPATAGIFAGAGMSSELRKPSKSIPKGTLWGLLLTFVCYSSVILSLGCSVPRASLHEDVQIIQTVSGFQSIILVGELSTSVFSVIVGMVGAAYVLEAISKDNILPGISIFGEKPTLCLLSSWFLTQLCLFSDVNNIATFITMTFLMTFIVMNMACFLLEISSAPNFRPSFKWFNRYTALLGAILAILAMYVVDNVSASAVISFLCLLFVIIHYFCPPKPWGDVSQSLIYHQVRKYLLRLKQDNVKYWRPQVLLLVDNPRTSWNLIKFCNHLKKGGLYILGHVTVAADFQSEYQELNKQVRAWMNIRDMAGIKAFVQIGMGPTLAWGIRNVFMGSGLGGMKPNITVIGFFDLKNYLNNKIPQRTGTPSPLRDDIYLKATKNNDRISIYIPSNPGFASLPTDECKNEEKVKLQQWVQVIEDLSLMRSNIAIAYGFKNLQLPKKNETREHKGYIDLYPIQMSATIVNENSSGEVTTTNFDTYTLILQLGAILTTVPDWHKTHQIRVIVFVENETERSDERKRIENLLSVLRIEAEVLVLSLDQFRVYNTIVKGDPISKQYVDDALKEDDWWNELTKERTRQHPIRKFTSTEPTSVKIDGNHLEKRYDVSKLQRLGVSLTMTSSMPTTDMPSNESEYESDYVADTYGSTSTLLNTPGQNNNNLHPVRSMRLRDDASVRTSRPVFSSKAMPKTKVIEEATGEQPTLVPIVDNSTNGKLRPILHPLSPCQSSSDVIEETDELTFNQLSSRAQHLVLHDMMSQVSSKSKLLLSTLPLPPLGTHKSEQASLEYVQNIDLWLDGLPPTILINSQSMTVTTAL
ncbi:Transmembrane amino acid transporter protein [Kluyveromyces marxianus]